MRTSLSCKVEALYTLPSLALATRVVVTSIPCASCVVETHVAVNGASETLITACAPQELAKTIPHNK